MNRMKIFVGMLMFMSVLATAQDKSTATAATQVSVATTAEDKMNITSTPHASVATENQILRAEHTHDQAVTAQTNAQMNLTNLQTQYERYVKQFNDAKTKADSDEKTSAKTVDEAIENAWKESKLDKTEYDFDPANFTFKPITKTPVAPEVKK
jgi:hypothetical protein